MVVLGIENQAELTEWENQLTVEYHSFVEPDRNNEKTAIAISPAADPKQFRKLKLL